MSTIKIRRSSVAGKKPTTGQLTLGELALNTHDGRLFTKQDDGSVSIVSFVKSDEFDSVRHDGLIRASSFAESVVPYNGNAPSLDLSQGQYFAGTSKENTVFSFDVSGVQLGGQDAFGFLLEVNQGATARTLTFPNSVLWREGAPPLGPAANQTGLYAFVTRNSGATWLGSLAGRYA
jgi:hypothetical protein